MRVNTPKIPQRSSARRASTKSFKVALLQPELKSDSILDNARELDHLLAKCMVHRPDLVLMPEICAGRSPSSDLKADARVYKKLVAKWAALTRQKNCALYASIVAHERGKIFNQAVWIEQGRVKARYNKIHLFGLDGENKRFAAGHSPGLVKTKGGTAGLFVCYDLRFPELMRVLMQRGANLLVCCAQWPSSRQEHWKALLKARAIENQVFVLACNRRGSKNGQVYAGGSCVISPWGDVLYELDQTQSFGICEIDLSDVAAIRKQYPFYGDQVLRIQ